MAQLQKVQKKKNLTVVGVMNGTSIDACDFVLCRLRRGRGERLAITALDFATFRFPKKLRERLLAAASNLKHPLFEVSRLHHDLGQYYAKCALKLRHERGWAADAYAIHGQTIYHEGARTSIQIGEVAYVSQALQLPVAFDFRSADIAVGGQGSPLAPALHLLLAESLGPGAFAFHNLGGISNLTYIHGHQVIAFDTGPANILIDAWIAKKSKGKKSFDRGGQCAAQGLVEPDLLKELMKSSYLRKRAPKSCGREEFGEDFLKEFARLAQGMTTNDQLASLTEFTAKSIEQSYRKLIPELPRRIFLCGGGAKNDYLVGRLRYLLPEVEIRTTSELGWPVETIEGGAFAVLGARAIWGLRTDLRAITGAGAKICLGKICSP